MVGPGGIWWVNHPQSSAVLVTGFHFVNSKIFERAQAVIKYLRLISVVLSENHTLLGLGLGRIGTTVAAYLTENWTVWRHTYVTTLGGGRRGSHFIASPPPRRRKP